jgi:DNA polymerase
VKPGGESRIPAGAPLDAGLDRLAREGNRVEILAIPDLPRLRTVADACRRCRLHETRTRPVFADGTPEARVMCVGEAPGQREDETGLPFVGRAGQLLDRMLTAVGLGRDRVFICNVLKCRPPRNRNPLPEEIEQCSPFLLRQLELVDPVVVIAFGTFAARTLLGSSESLGRLRQRTHQYEGRPLVVTYHPAALLRNPGWIRPTWEDLQRVRSILDGDAKDEAMEHSEGSR